MSETYWLIHVDGNMERITTDGIMPLSKMQELVGGSVEHTRIGVLVDTYPMNMDAFVNEEGWVTDPPLEANKLYPHLAGNILLGRCAYGEKFENGLEFYGVESDTLGELIPSRKEAHL